MNENVGLLNIYFQQNGNPSPLVSGQSLADYFPASIFIYDAERKCILYGNRKFNDFTGGTVNVGEPAVALQSFIHPEDYWRIEKLLKESVAASAAVPASCTARLVDCRRRMVMHHIQGSPLKEEEDESRRQILFIAHDITDLLKSKEEIETTRELLEETEELLQFGSWAWDVSTNTVSWTGGLYSLLGYSPREVAGRAGFDFYLSHVLEEFVQPFQEMIAQAVRNKADFSYEYLIKTRSGVIKTISTRGKVVKDEAGEVLKILCINRDITALRNFEKEQARNIQELNRSNRDLEEFAYIASHDLQEPLRKISMFTERLMNKYKESLDEEGELFIARILASAGNMRTLIDNLLEFSRANRRSVTFDQVDIRSVFESVCSELELKIEETKATVDLSGTFPTIEAVASEMKQLFGNIVSNAIKFRKSSTIPRVSVQSGKLSKARKAALGLPQSSVFYELEIRDNGIGFEPQYSEKIFQIFQRLNGKAEFPGSGIGLAICKKIVEKHHGLIFATSVPDQGATFTVILPEKQF